MMPPKSPRLCHSLPNTDTGNSSQEEECDHGDPASMIVNDIVDDQEGGQLHHPTQGSSCVDIRAHRPSRDGEAVVDPTHREPAEAEDEGDEDQSGRGQQPQHALAGLRLVRPGSRSTEFKVQLSCLSITFCYVYQQGLCFILSVLCQ